METSHNVNLERRSVVLRALISATLTVLLPFATTASAQVEYPNKPIRLVVPYPAGGGSDIGARILAESLARTLKSQVVVENRAGAGGNIGGEYVAKSQPDGYTLLFGAMANLAINPHLYKDMRYVPERDFTPIAEVFYANHVIVASPNSGFNSFDQFLQATKKSPAKYTYASGGTGTSTHVLAEMFTDATKTKLVHVPYKGNGPALVDVMAGQVDLMFDQVPNSAKYIAAKKVTALAVTSKQRLSEFPDVPTVTELGYPQLTISSWSGLFGPAKLPPEIVSKLAEATRQALADPDVANRLEKAGATPSFRAPDGMRSLLQTDAKRFKGIVERADIRLN